MKRKASASVVAGPTGRRMGQQALVAGAATRGTGGECGQGGTCPMPLHAGDA